MVWILVWVINTVYWFRITFTFLFALAVLLYEPAVRINDAVNNSHTDSDAVVQWWMQWFLLQSMRRERIY